MDFTNLVNKVNNTDWKKWIHNTIKFLAPAILIFLVVLQRGGGMHDALIAIYTWALSTAIDLTSKFIAADK